MWCNLGRNYKILQNLPYMLIIIVIKNFQINTCGAPLLGLAKSVYRQLHPPVNALMHQSIPVVPTPPPPGQPRGICLRCQSRGLGISIPRGDPRAFDTHVFERWMSLSGRLRPLSKTALSVRD